MKKNLKLVPYSQYKIKTNKIKHETTQYMAQRYYISKELKERPKEIKKESKCISEDTKYNISSKMQSQELYENIKKLKNNNSTSNYFKVINSPALSESSFSTSILDLKTLQSKKINVKRDYDDKQENLFQGEKININTTIKNTPVIRTQRRSLTIKDIDYSPKLARSKLLQKAEQLAKENGETGTLSLQSGISVKHGQIKAGNTANNIIKTYYVAKNYNSKSRLNVKSAILSEKSQNIIVMKRRQIYKNYQLKDLISDRLAEQSKRSQYNKNKTTDTSSEAIKLTRQTISDIKDIKKTVVHGARQTIKAYKFKEHQKSKLNEKLLNSRFKNTKIAQSLDKSYKRDQARKKIIYDHYKKSQFQRNIQRISSLRMKVNITRSKTVSFFAIKVGVPIFSLLILYMFFGFITTQLINGTNGYIAIGAEKDIILNYQNHVSQLDSDFKKIIRLEESEGKKNHDKVIVNIASDSGEIQNNFKEYLVMAAVLFEQNLQYSSQEINKIDSWYSLMNGYSTKIESYEHNPGCKYRPPKNDNDEGSYHCPGHTKLYINVYCLTMEDIFSKINFDTFQIDWARQLMLFDLDLLYPGMGFETSGGISGWNGMSNEEIINIIKNLPKAGATRDKIVDTALSIVGKVPYFWGGKSSPGWNDLWNTPQKVTAPGTSDSGTTIPYGLDCSGFVDWAFKTAGATNILGGGTAHQWGQSYGIDRKVALPGDIVFKNPPNSGGINHIGIYIGKDNSGKDLFVHCAYGSGVTIDNGPGLKYWRRVKVNLD